MENSIPKEVQDALDAFEQAAILEGRASVSDRNTGGHHRAKAALIAAIRSAIRRNTKTAQDVEV